MDRSLIVRICLVSLLSAATGVCAAQERRCRDISFPEHVSINGMELSLNGLGVRKATFLKVNVYIAALYTTKQTHDAALLINSEGPEKLVLHFVRDVGVDDLTKAFREAFEREGADQSPSMKQRTAKLNGWMADMKKGQRLIFIRIPHAGMQVVVDGVQKGTIEGDDFSRAFVSIWLGATPPNPELKSGLLGEPCE